MFPNNINTEKEIVWLLINDRESVPKITSKVVSSDFYNLIHKNNFISAVESYKKDGVVDIHKIEQIYDYSDVEYVSALWIPKLCKQLRELSKRRRMAMLATEILEKTNAESSEIVKRVMEVVLHVNQITEDVKTDANTIAEKVLKSWEESRNKDILGLSCGYKTLDEMISGFREGHLWVVGGYTNYGKTTLALSFLAHLLKTYNTPLLFCSLEMSQEQIFEKIVCNLNRCTATFNRRNYNLPDVLNQVDLLKNSKLQITDNLNTVEGITMKVEEMAIAGEKPSVVFIDFIQNIQGSGKSEYERITNATIALQALARRLKVCIVLLSQVNNQSVGANEVIGFKSSGALASAGDITIQIVRNKTEELKGTHEIVDMDLIIQKNRHGRGGIVALEFDITKGLIIGH